MKGSSASDFINYQEEIKSVIRSLSLLNEINNVQYKKVYLNQRQNLLTVQKMMKVLKSLFIF